MANTHDQTLLARMGFSDPDKKLHEHDMACRYLAQATTCNKILTTLGLDWTFSDSSLEVPIVKGQGSYMQYVGFIDTVAHFSRLVKGEARVRPNQNVIRSSSGEFWACESGVDGMRMAVPPSAEQDGTGLWHIVKTYYSSPAVVVVEAKITPVTLGDSIRQMKLYRSFREHIAHKAIPGPGYPKPTFLWVLATRYQLSQSDADTLLNEQILHVHLGEGFSSYLTEQQSSQESASSLSL